MIPLRLTVGYVAGVTPTKWARAWAERHPEVPLLLQAIVATGAVEELRAGAIDVALLRPPVDTSGLALINLYEENTVVVVPADHLFSAVDTVAVADLDGEPILIPLDNAVAWADGLRVQVDQRPETAKDATELVAAGIGALIVPQSLARLNHRKDLIFRPIADAPTCPVALAVPEGQQPALVEEFIGIVRGRKPNSSRGRSEPVPKRTAREKTLAKQAARAAAGKVARKPGRAARGRR